MESEYLHHSVVIEISPVGCKQWSGLSHRRCVRRETLVLNSKLGSQSASGCSSWESASFLALQMDEN
jgi:hypothetical protein